MTGLPPLTVTYKLELDDFRAIGRITPSGSRRRLKLQLWTAAWVILLIQAMSETQRTGKGIFGLILAPTYTAMYVHWITRGKSRMTSRFDTGALSTPVTLQVDEEGVRFLSEDSVDKHPWRRLKLWIESDQLIVIKSGDTMWDIVPKRDLLGEQVVLLRQHLNAGIGLATPPRSTK